MKFSLPFTLPIFLVVACGLLGLTMLASTEAVLAGYHQEWQRHADDVETYGQLAKERRDIVKSLPAYIDEGVDTAFSQQALQTVNAYLRNGQYDEAVRLLNQIEEELIQLHEQKQTERAQAETAAAEAAAVAQRLAEEAERNKGDILGTIKSGTSIVADATVSLLSNGTIVTSALSSGNGVYSIKHAAGSYTFQVEKRGYVTYRKENVEIKSQDVTTVDANITKSSPKPAATSTPSPATGSDNTAYSEYRSTSVSTSRGTFSVRLLTINLDSGHIRVVTDTAADGDCTNGCPVKSVKSYVTQHGGFAGVNGTYFCPTSYGASCAGKTNSFYWKFYNTRLQSMINRWNELGHKDPFLTFDNNGRGRFYKTWDDYNASGVSISAGISCRPLLTYNGSNVLDEATLDDKERTAYTVRTGIGLKGQTLYVAVVSGATIIDLAAVMQQLGVENSLNIDGGGSSALYYKGSHKSGPGRDVPNAIVFAER